MPRTVARSALASVAVALALVATSPLPAGAQDDPTTTTTTTTATTTGGTGAPKTPSGDPAIDDLVGCMQGSRRLEVLFLIDESASLKATDPDDQRVEAARGALDSLVSLASAEGSAAPRVDVALAAFSNEYRLVQDWTSAGPDTASTLDEALAKFAGFDRGIDTDFVNALSAGREALADQAASVTTGGGQAPCRAIMLFTDGGYDLAVRTSAADQERLGTTKPYAPGIELTSKADVLKAETAGRKALCKPGGLADRLRNDDITLLTVALSGDVARRAQLPLAAATAGTADGYPCGTQAEEGEDARVPGAYLPAEDIDVLVTQFNGVGIRLAGGNLVPGPGKVEICGADPCDQGTRTFTLDKTLRRAQILALPPKPGASVVLEGPEGDPVTITKDGRSEAGATTVVARSLAGRGFIIDLARPDDLEAWNGEWKVSITDPSGAQEGDRASLQIYVFSDIDVAFGRLPAFQRGASTPIEVRLVVPKGVKGADVIEASQARVRLHDPVTGKVETVALEGGPAGPFKGTVTTSEGTTTNVMEATAEVQITTRGGAELVSQSAPSEVLVRRPEGSIQFAPGSLKLPSLTGEGSTETELLLLGGEKPGCVWFGKASVDDPPEGAGPIDVTYEGEPLPGEKDCITVPAKRPTTIVLEATPAGRASGTVSGTIEVFEKVQGADDATTTEIPFRFDMARGVDEAQRLLLTVVLLLAGLGLPLLALLVINAIAARFQVLDVIRGAAIPVRAKGTTVQRTDGTFPKPLSLRPADFVSLASAGNDRSFTFGGVVFRARASRNPFGGTIAMAAPEGGAERLRGGEGSRVELDPSLAGSWVFLLDAERTRRGSKDEVDGLLIAFVAEGDFTTQTDRMLPDIADRLPATASSLAGLVRETRRRAPSKRQVKAATARAEGHEPADEPPQPDGDGADDVDGVDDVLEGEEVLGTTLEGPADEASETDEAPPTDQASETDETPETDEAPTAPAGFGGTSRAAPPVAPTPPPAEGGSDDDDPGPPPVGFSGARPDR